MKPNRNTLKALILLAGYNPHQLAQKLGITHQRVYQFFNNLPEHRAREVAEALWMNYQCFEQISKLAWEDVLIAITNLYCKENENE